MKSALLYAERDGVNPFSPGDDILYLVKVSNTGLTPITGVTFIDAPDVNTSLVSGSVSTSQGTVTNGNQAGDSVVGVSIGLVPPGGTVTITFVVTIRDPLPPGITEVMNQGTVTSNEVPDIVTDDPGTVQKDDFTVTLLNCPLLSMGICPKKAIAKPDSVFQVCICQTDSRFHSLDEEYVNSLFFSLEFDTTVIWFDSTFTLENTCLDSTGWDLKWKHPGGNRSIVQAWLISGGEAASVVSCDSCLVILQFHVNGSAAPGDDSPIILNEAIMNEGWPCVEVTHGLFQVNSPPVITWNGETAPDTIDTIFLQESHDFSALVHASDHDIDTHHPCGDSIRLWAETFSLCPWMDRATFAGQGAVAGVSDTVVGCGDAVALFEWHPPKLGTCDDIWIDFIASSTWETDQPLFDTLSVHFIVDNCDIMGAWALPPPDDGPDPGDPSAPYEHGYVDLPFDTTDVHACGEYEFPIAIHFDYEAALIPPIWALYFEVDYDTRLELLEIGNEGLDTEQAGIMTCRVDDDKIQIAMAFNDTLENFFYGEYEVCPWYAMAYVGFKVPHNLETSTILDLSIEYVKVNEGDLTSCWVDHQYLHVRDFAVTGRIFYSDTDTLWVPGVSVTTVWECGAEASSAVVTDASGWFSSAAWPGCSAFCLEPSRENDLTVEDQIVTSFDAVMILRALCGQITLSHNYSLAADVTGDGTVSAFDASTIVKWVVSNNSGTPLLPSEHIGEWIFEYNGDLGQQHGQSCACYSDLVNEHLYELFETVIIGDVTQNWLPTIPKSVGGDLAYQVRGNTIVFTFDPETYAVDLILKCDDLEPTAVRAAGGDLVEWAVEDDVLRVAVAGIGSVTEVKVTFTDMSPKTLDVSALVNERRVLTATAKIVPVPTEYNLAQNYPNPFNPLTSIEYALPEAAKVKLDVCNLLGQEIDILVDDTQEAGFYKTTWDASHVASGVYFYRIHANAFTATKKLVLLK
ncbi:MAG: T9SS type A sorting domain-containing protein [Gemmatimonadota bacterium]|nr:MAG: T9SS type A sorting domain-containing protein [Gemmatimonadota bacterium]